MEGDVQGPPGPPDPGRRPAWPGERGGLGKRRVWRPGFFVAGVVAVFVAVGLFFFAALGGDDDDLKTQSGASPTTVMTTVEATGSGGVTASPSPTHTGTLTPAPPTPTRTAAPSSPVAVTVVPTVVMQFVPVQVSKGTSASDVVAAVGGLISAITGGASLVISVRRPRVAPVAGALAPPTGSPTSSPTAASSGPPSAPPSPPRPPAGPPGPP